MAAGAPVAKPPQSRPPRLPEKPRGNEGVQQSIIDDINTPSQPQGEGQGEEKGPKKDEGSGVGVIAGIILLLVTPFLIIFGAVLGISKGKSSNPGGATTPQQIEVGHPSAELTNLLNTFSAASDTSAYLTKGSVLLDTYTTNLTLLQTKILANDPAYSSIRDRDGVLALIPVMLEQIATLKADVSGGQKDKLTKDAKDFVANVNKLNLLAAPSIVDIALTFANDNAASGYTKYQYNYGSDDLLYKGTGLSDCSAFMSTLLYKAGYTKIPTRLTTNEIFNAAQSGKYGLSLALTSTSNSGIDEATLKSTLQPGDIILSADVQYPGANSAVNNNHSVLFVGNGQVVESTTSSGKNGVQTDTLDDRIQHHGRIQAIIRPGSPK